MPVGDVIPAGAVERFRADVERWAWPNGKLGVAVSGGPDSLALLLLAKAAYPGGVEAVTVDHRLRAESADEAANVAAICAQLGVPHATLTLDWEPPVANIQARAREARYDAVAKWAFSRTIRFIATGHHLDDEAETLLMRLGRGAGVSGLAGTRPIWPLPNERFDAFCYLVRPLLGWRKSELGGLIDAAGLSAIDDPSNRDDRFDRTRARLILSTAAWLRPERLAASASHLKDAEVALAWMAATLFKERSGRDAAGRLTIDVEDIPREMQRRLLIYGLGCLGRPDAVPGPKLIRLLDTLLAGQDATLAGTLVRAGPPWSFESAPPRRT